MRVTINCGTADVETNVTWQHGFKVFFLSAQTVGEAKGHGPFTKVYCGRKQDSLTLRTESCQVFSKVGMVHDDQKADLVNWIHLV